MRSRRRFLLVLVLSAVFVLLGLFLNLGRWLVREDPLQKADALVVLSGKIPGRALEAARLYKQGYAGRVWLTYSKEPGESLAKLSIPYQGEEFYDKQVLIHEGVPPDSITVLGPPILNTVDEMRAIGEALEQQNLHSVIIVSSKVHTRRIRTLWHRLGRPGEQAIVRGYSDDSFDPSRWWRKTQDALDVVREVLGIANAWAGLPLKPAPQ